MVKYNSDSDLGPTSRNKINRTGIRLPVLLVLALQFSAYSINAHDAEDSAVLGNTISGKVDIVTMSGEHKQDRSNIVVFVEGVTLPAKPQQVEDSTRIGHKGKRFSPEVLPIVRGDSVDFFNDDDIFHNVFSLSRTQPFDLGVYPKGSSRMVRFDRTGLVRIYCNLHPNMVGNILILNNPYYAVTDPNGSYTISDVPDGQYRLRVWTEFSDAIGKDIDLTKRSVHSHSFTITETKKRIKHKNKYGKPYNGKY